MNLKVLTGTLIILFACATAGLAGDLEGKWGMGMFGSYYAPLFTFRDMYDQGGKFGATLNYVARPKWIAEVEGHYAGMAGGKLKEARFTFPADGLQYASDQADTKMFFTSIMVNWLHTLGTGVWETKGAPYAVFGAGFNYYDSKVSGLVWAGQSPPPSRHPDLTKIMETTHDKSVAVAFSGGLGYQHFMARNTALDLRVRYNLVLGELRPFAMWGVNRSYPFHLFDLGLGLRFFM